MRPELDRCERLLADHLADAVRCFGSAALGLVDLPPIASGALVPTQIRVAAVLLWARELEEAGLLPFVEAMAEGVTRGTLLVPLGDSAGRLVEWHRGRSERLGADERRGLYAQLFDGTTGPLEGLVATLGEIGRTVPPRSTRHLEARANVIGRELAGMLSDRAVGMAAWAARDIAAQVRNALALLREPEIAGALGGGTTWSMIRHHAPALLGRELDPTRPLALASAGLALVQWLADHADELERGTARIASGDPVVSAALAWQAEGAA